MFTRISLRQVGGNGELKGILMNGRSFLSYLQRYAAHLEQKRKKVGNRADKKNLAKVAPSKPGNEPGGDNLLKH